METLEEISVLIDIGSTPEKILSLVEDERAQSRRQCEFWIDQIRSAEDYTEGDEDYIMGYRQSEDDKEENINLVFNVSGGITKQNCEYVLSALRKLKAMGVCVRPSLMMLDSNAPIQKIPGMFASGELKKLSDLCNAVKSEGLSTSGELGIRELSNDYDVSFGDVIKANALVKKMAQKIKDANLSPFEAVLFAHNFCTSFFYNAASYDVSSREIEGIVRSGNIVCVGYASLFKAILDEANVSGLKVKITSLEDKSPTSHGGHSNNVVEIDDPQYGIHGTYICDTCYDSATYFSPQTLCNCLFPASDIEKSTRTPLYYSTNATGELYSIGSIAPVEKHVGALRKQHNDFVANNQASPIEIDTFFEGLYNMGIKTGKTPQAATDHASKLVEDSVAQARTFFAANASNCFSRTSHALGLKPEQAYNDPFDTFYKKKKRALKKVQQIDQNSGMNYIVRALKKQAILSDIEREEEKLSQIREVKTCQYAKQNLDLVERSLDE